jgi:hypothetical protein
MPHGAHEYGTMDRAMGFVLADLLIDGGRAFSRSLGTVTACRAA